MDRALRIYGRFIEGIGLILKYTGILLITGIVLSIFVQVVSRYLFNRPHVWVEEFATYSFIWLVFTGAAYAHIKGRHILVTTLTDCLYKPLRRVLAVGSNVLIVVFLIVVIRYGFRQFIVEGPQSTIALPVQLPRRLFYSVPFLISMLTMLLTTLQYLFMSVMELISPSTDPECEEAAQ